MLILGDFNTHICCLSHSLTSQLFLDLIDSFNLIQFGTHILNLVLSSGFSLKCLNLVEMFVNDHKAVAFKVPPQLSDPSPCCTTHSCDLSADSAVKFCDAVKLI